MRGMVTVLAAVLVSSTALARGKDVQKYLDAATSLYESLEYERALEQLSRAKTIAQGPNDDVAIALLEGIVLADSGKEEKAAAALRSAFALDPDARSPLELSPKTQSLVERIRSEVKKRLANLPREEREEGPTRFSDRQPPPPAAVEVKTAPERRGREGMSPWIPTVAGALVGGGGAYCLVQAKIRHDRLVGGTVAAKTEADRARDEGKTYQTAGWVLAGVGATALIAGAVLFAVAGADEGGEPEAIRPTSTPRIYAFGTVGPVNGVGIGGTFP